MADRETPGESLFGSGRQAVGALLALAASAFLYVTAETLPIGLLQPMSAGLGASTAAVGQLVTVYGLVVVLASLPLTYLTRGVARRPLLAALLVTFAASTAAGALAPSYPVLLGARVVTALSQALFWSVVIPTAITMFPLSVRGRVVAVVFGGGSLAAVLGVSAGTWFGQQLGWRAAFLGLALLGVLAATAVVALLPGSGGSGGSGGTARRDPQDERAPEADGRRYAVLVLASVLTVSGAFTFFTYVSPYLIDELGLAPGLVGLVLFLRGLGGLAGVVLSGPLIDHRRRLAVVVPITVQVVALLVLGVPGVPVLIAIALVASTGLAFSALTAGMSERVLRVAPGRFDLASAGASTAVNVGITGGALIGGILLSGHHPAAVGRAGPGSGSTTTALVGGALTLAGLVVAIHEARSARAGQGSPPVAG